MERKIKFSEWRSATTDLPTEDGMYLVLRFDKYGNCYSGQTLSYTVVGGWNTNVIDADKGIYSTESAIVYDEDENAVWAKVFEDKE